MKEMDLSQVKRIAIDETSSRKGHHYISLIVDIDTKRVLYATEGKGSDVLHAFKAFLEEGGIPATQIEACCCDMSPAFIKGVQEAFPKAEITFDKFHVMKMVNEAVDKVRREEQKDHAELKKTRFIWLKNEENLSTQQKEALLKLKDENLATARAYRLKLAFQDFWKQRTIYADLYLAEWYNWAIRSQLEPFIELAKSIKKHENGILQWFQSRLLEGINDLVQTAKRRARSYRNVENLIAMVYMTANKLRLPMLEARRAQ